MTTVPDMTDMHSLDVFRHYDRSHWRLADLNLSDIDPTRVRPQGPGVLAVWA